MIPSDPLSQPWWEPDQLVTNHFGDLVWLRECYDGQGRRMGITDCCFAVSPCHWHLFLSKG